MIQMQGNTNVKTFHIDFPIYHLLNNNIGFNCEPNSL